MGPCVARDVVNLQSCQAALFWRARFFEGLRLISANGEAYEIVRADVRRPASYIAQRLAKFLDLRIRVEITARHIGPASLADVVRVVDKAIDEDAETFEEFSGRSVLWWKHELTRCSTVSELIQILGADT